MHLVTTLILMYFEIFIAWIKKPGICGFINVIGLFMAMNRKNEGRTITLQNEFEKYICGFVKSCMASTRLAN